MALSAFDDPLQVTFKQASETQFQTQDEISTKKLTKSKLTPYCSQSISYFNRAPETSLSCATCC